MTSLFLRIFLWFCAIAALIVAAVIAGFLRDAPSAALTSWRDFGHRSVILLAGDAAAAYEQGGRQALERELRRVAGALGVRAALLDESGENLAGTGLTLRGAALEELKRGGEREITIVDRWAGLAGVRTRGPQGGHYLFALEMPPREAGPWGRVFLVSLLAAGALFCFALARSVAAPVAHLRALTRQLSAGDLATRVTAPAILERHDEIGDLGRDFNHMAARIDSLVQAQRRLIADVAHELRSPMTRLGLALGLMRRAGAADPASLARMSRELDRLNELTLQLLTLSRLEHLEKPGAFDAVDLSAAIREIAQDADFEAVSSNVAVRLGQCDPCTIRGVPELIRSAIENVVRNAVRYTEPRTEVSIRLTRLERERRAQIVVEDRGPGISGEHLTHIFEPFYRVDPARDPHTGGAGLGLAITFRIVSLHGGQVEALNRPGGGLEFRIAFPLELREHS